MYRALIALLTCGLACAAESFESCATKKVTINGAVTLHQRYIYRGYLQIACCDLTRSSHPCLWLLTWDPSQSKATRPLAIRKDGTWFAYGWDSTKNICEIYSSEGRISTAYTYTPFGQVDSQGAVTQPFQWSSEYYDDELALSAYVFRYYNSQEGMWLSRDEEEETHIKNLYAIKNPLMYNDYLGLFPLFGLDVTIDVPFGIEACFAPFPFAFPFAKVCVNMTNVISAGTCCSNGEVKAMTKTEFSASVSAGVETDVFPSFSVIYKPTISLGDKYEACPQPVEMKFDGFVGGNATAPGIEANVRYLIFNGEWDVSVSVAWTTSFSISLSGGIVGKATSVSTKDD